MVRLPRLPLPQSFWPHMPSKPSSGLAQVFGQQDSSVSNPSSGSQILRPCGVLPFLLNPLPGPGQTGLPWCCVPDTWSPGLGSQRPEPRTTRAGAWEALTHSGAVESVLPPSSGVRVIYGRCREDRQGENMSQGMVRPSPRQPPSHHRFSRKGKGLNCLVTSGRSFLYSGPLLPLKWD